MWEVRCGCILSSFAMIRSWNIIYMLHTDKYYFDEYIDKLKVLKLQILSKDNYGKFKSRDLKCGAQYRFYGT